MAASSKPFDITLLTDRRYVHPQPGNAYVENIFREDELLTKALEARGMKVHRTNWDDPEMNWSNTRFALFRTTWDYFERFAEFSEWLDRTAKLTTFINNLPLIRWNSDKHYLGELQANGVAIPPTVFIPRRTEKTLSASVQETPWQELILKPTVAGAARHTYRFLRGETMHLEEVFSTLISEEDMMLQQFQESILSEGEVTLMVFGGKYTHAVKKIAKPGDFRVQDDFGGTVHPYLPSQEEVLFAENAVSLSPMLPVYARVDIIKGNQGQLYLSEMEMIEPELWMRMHPHSAEVFADALHRTLK